MTSKIRTAALVALVLMSSSSSSSASAATSVTDAIVIDSSPSLASSVRQTAEKVRMAEMVPVVEDGAVPSASEIPLALPASEDTDEMTIEKAAAVVQNANAAPSAEGGAENAAAATTTIEFLGNPSLPSSTGEAAEKVSGAEKIQLSPESEMAGGIRGNPSLASSTGETADESMAHNFAASVEIPAGGDVNPSPVAPSNEGEGTASDVGNVLDEDGIAISQTPISNKGSIEILGQNDRPEFVAAMPTIEMPVTSPHLTGMGGDVVAASDHDRDESLYSLARDNSSHYVTAIGGAVGFAVLLSLALFNGARSRRNAYVVVVGTLAVGEEAV